MIVKCGGTLFNMKLGTFAPCLNKPSCLVGVEVTKMGKDKKYSLVGTNNRFHNKIITEEIIQKGGEDRYPINEFIDILSSKFKSPPETFIIYRNGESSFQNKTIVEDEIAPLRKHLEELEKKTGGKHKCAFVLTSKQAELKFFQKQQGGLNNPRSGLIIDEVVTTPNSYEFYLQPQFVNQGTATPTKFTVKMDTTDLNIEELQEITYFMCFYYWNWAGAIRVPSVLKYSEVLHKFASINLGKEPKKINDRIKNSPFFI